MPFSTLPLVALVDLTLCVAGFLKGMVASLLLRWASISSVSRTHPVKGRCRSRILRRHSLCTSVTLACRLLPPFSGSCKYQPSFGFTSTARTHLPAYSNFIVAITFPRLLGAFGPQGAFGWYAAWKYVVSTILCQQDLTFCLLLALLDLS